MSKPITPDEIRKARAIAAKLTQRDPQYLPIFERLDAELIAATTNQPTLADRLRMAAQDLDQPHAA